MRHMFSDAEFNKQNLAIGRTNAIRETVYLK